MKRLLSSLILALAAGVAGAADGKAVYDANCAACHQPDGAGALGLAPPLAGTLGKRMAVPEGRKYLPGIVIAGLAGKMESKGVMYEGIMPNWQQFSDAELAAVLNHVLTTFNAAELPADFKPIEADELAAARAKKPTAKELRAWRAASQ
ncbi:cytochrome c [Dechloromonas sp. ARDL1]|uniref:c-type cytochrome n=1 Tax=Dechloromonas sp. ARDL1 TaxID=3322121 RepID=UPI003DA6F79B